MVAKTMLTGISGWVGLSGRGLDGSNWSAGVGIRVACRRHWLTVVLDPRFICLVVGLVAAFSNAFADN